jgi:CubicO group peptidase (beta-lactamase class C family)
MTTVAQRTDSCSPLALDLRPAREVATAHVRSGTIPCAAFGVVDASGRSATAFISGPAGVPRPDSVFFLASITKAIVATAVMRYVDEGRLALHAPLARCLPELDGGALAEVTAWHVLTHTSGLPDMQVESLRRERPNYRRSLEFVRSSVPEAAPGSRYAYNSVAFILLAEAMARLSGTTFSQALAMRLTEPLGMADTTFDARSRRDRVIPVSGFGVDNRLVQEVLMRFLASATLPGGGLFGTLPDLLALARALLPIEPAASGPRILSQGAIDEMARDQTEGMLHVSEDGVEREVRQALGWRKPLREWPGSESAFTHGGIAGGRIWVDPEAGLGIVFLTNQWQAPVAVSVDIIDAIYRAGRG